MELNLILRAIERILDVTAGMLCVYLGYVLFVRGISGKASLRVEFDKTKLQIANAMPGVFFGLFGIVMLVVAMRQTVTVEMISTYSPPIEVATRGDLPPDSRRDLTDQPHHVSRSAVNLDDGLESHGKTARVLSDQLGATLHDEGAAQDNIQEQDHSRKKILRMFNRLKSSEAPDDKIEKEWEFHLDYGHLKFNIDPYDFAPLDPKEKIPSNRLIRTPWGPMFKIDFTGDDLPRSSEPLTRFRT